MMAMHAALYTCTSSLSDSVISIVDRLFDRIDEIIKFLNFWELIRIYWKFIKKTIDVQKFRSKFRRTFNEVKFFWTLIKLWHFWTSFEKFELASNLIFSRHLLPKELLSVPWI